MYFKRIYKPIPLIYNLILAMLWRHPENVELEKVKVVHYCAAVSYFVSNFLIKSLDSGSDIVCFTFLSGFEAMEIHREGTEHGEGRHKNVSEELVGHLQR